MKINLCTACLADFRPAPRLRHWLLVVSLSLFSLVSELSLGAATPGSGKSQQLQSLDETPKGLAKSDWASIRAAYEAGQHAFQPIEGGWQARNPGQQWTTKFDQSGFLTTPKGGGWSWGLELERGTTDSPVNTGARAADKNGRPMLSFPRSAAITEWFINDQRGLEQGWTLSGPAEIRLRVRGSLKHAVSPQSISFGGQITYAGLKAWDATGKTVPTHFEATEQGFAVCYDDSAAQYPITIDPLAQQAYIKPAIESLGYRSAAGDRFGYSVAVSGDTVVVGADSEDSSSTGINSTPNESASDAGAAYVFVRSSGTWTQQAYLKAAQVSAGDRFGYSVAVSGDTVVVGATGEDSITAGINWTPNELANDAGAAYVFVRSGSTWTQQAYLKAAQVTASDWFGVSVAVSGDTVVVGAHLEDSSTTGINSTPNEVRSNAGAAYVFVRSGSTWTQQAYLKASQVSVGDGFGYSVAVDGDTVVVGATGEDSSTTGINSTPNESDSDTGAAYVFVRSGSTWTQQAYLKAAQVTASDQFGNSVAVSGNTVVVGARFEDSSTTGINSTPNESAGDAGAAYVFVRSGSTWTQQAYLKAAQVTASDSFGNSVAVSGDTVVVGATWEDSSTAGINSTPNESASNAGAAYVFVRSGSTWTQQAYLKAAQVSVSDEFGSSVAVSGDTVVVGAMWEDSSTAGINSTPNEAASSAGAAYVYVRSGSTWTQEAYMKPSVESLGLANLDDGFGGSVTVSGDTVVVGATGEDSSSTGINSTPDESASNAGAAYVFVRSSGTWTQQAYLKAAQVTASDGFGGSVALSGDTLVVGALNEDSSTTGINSTPNESASNAGAAYVFVRSGSTWTQQAYLKAAQVTGSDSFGISVAVSGDTVVVGATDEDSSTTGINSTPNELAVNAGAAYVFARSGSTWTQQAYLKAAQVSGSDGFGRSVAVSGDTLVVGARFEDSDTTGINSTPNELAVNAGAAYVFARSGSTWTQQAYLKAAQVSVSDGFGGSVALSGDTLVVGATGEDSSTTGINSTPNESANDAGAAYVFARSGSTWTQQAYLKASQVTASDGFGGSVAVSGDTLVVGAPGEDSSTTGINSTPNELASVAGAAYVFLRSGSTWIQQAYLKAAQVTASDGFGGSVAVSGDTVVVGATGEDSSTTGINSTPNDGSSNTGAAYLFNILPTPYVTGISPTTGSTLGGTSVTITGTNFTGTTAVTIGGAAATNVVVTNANTLTCTAPAGTVGTANVLVTTPLGTNVPTTVFTYVAFPVLTSISPSIGLPAGNTTVTITGSNFTGTTGATIGGVSASNFSVVNSTTITCRTPAGTAGAKDVVVTKPGGVGVGTGFFTYVGPPSLTSVLPAAGPLVGGTALTISGDFFYGVTGVTIGGVPASDVTVINPTTLTCIAPAGNPGTKSVVVTAMGGVNGANTLYAYHHLPTITSITPSTVPITGGTAVTITGSKLVGITSVTIGGAAASSVVVTSPTTLTCVTPAGALGAANVIVTNPIASSPAHALFTYQQPSLALSNNRLTEGNAANATVGTLSVANADSGATYTFTLVSGVGSADNGSFTLTGSALKITPVTVFASKSSYDLRVRATDGGGQSVEQAFTVSVMTNTANVAPSFVLPTEQETGLTWVPRETARAWSGIASSANGSKLVACVNNGGIYTSTDSGVTWTARITDASRRWSAVASSADGSTLAAGMASVSGSPSWIYVSRDSGVTWTPRLTNVASVTWRAITLPNDGSRIAAVASTGQIYTSADFGVTWAPRETARDWQSIASSADGSRLVASVNGGQLYTSTDFGVTWTARESARAWRGVASSADGQKLVALVNAGSIYTSTDAGVTWTARATARAWDKLASSADGDTLMATVSSGQLFRSTNAGVTWAASESARTWTGIACSASGDKVAAVASSGLIYTSAPVVRHPAIMAGSGPFSLPGFASSISPGPVAEVAQTVSFTVTNSNNALFTAQPAIAADGTLTFTVGNLPGFATVTVVAVDSGGTANGGVNTSAPQTFTITVNQAAPTDLAISTTNLAENNAANATVGSLTATDPNLSDTHTFTLVPGAGAADNASFTILGNALKITPVTNYAAKSTYALRLRATDPGGLFVEKALMVTILPAGAGGFTMSALGLSSLPYNSQRSIVEDFDRDGRLDVVRLDSRELHIHNSKNNYAFGVIDTSLLGSWGGSNGNSVIPTRLAAADFNSDGYLDLAVGYTGSYNFGASPVAGVWIFLNSSTAGFSTTASSASITFAAPAGGNSDNYPAWLGAFDYSGDGIPDIILRKAGSLGFHKYSNNGVGSYFTESVADQTAATNITTDFSMHYANVYAAGDFDRNGIQDIAFQDMVSGVPTLSVLYGATKYALFTTSGTMNSMTTADFNNDGHLDLAVGVDANSFRLFYGTGVLGSSGFTSGLTFTLPVGSPAARQIKAGDMNLDGLPDLVVSTASAVHVYLGNGASHFSLSRSVPVENVLGYVTDAMTVADFTQDGAPDVLLNDTRLLVNTTPAIFPQRRFSFLAGAKQAATPAKLGLVTSSPLGSTYTVTSSFSWLSATPNSGPTGWSATSVQANHLAADPANDLPIKRHQGTLTYTAPGFQPATSRVTLDVVKASGSLGAPTGVIPLPHTVYSRPEAADFNNDGRMDLVYIARVGSTDIPVVLLTNANSSTTTVESPALGAINDPQGSKLALGDFNGDGIVDLALYATSPSRLYLAPGNGIGVLGVSGTTKVTTVITQNVSSVSFAAGDFDNDGLDDVVLTAGDRAAVVLGTKGGIFRQAAPFAKVFSSAGYRSSMALGDFNGDGNLDIAAQGAIDITSNSRWADVTPGDGRGGFVFGSMSSITNVRRVAAGDFNDDGISDLVTADGSAIHLRLGAAGSGLQAPAQIATTTLTAIKLADLNGDGRLDIIAVGGTGAFSISIGNGNGTFLPAKQIPGSTFSSNEPVHVGDFTGDGLPDMVRTGDDIHAWGNLVRIPGQEAATTTTLATTGASSVYGQPVPVTVTVAAVNAASEFNAPIGNVSLRKAGSIIASSSRTTPGLWTFTPVGLGVGSHTVTAQYDGDLRHTVSNTGATTVTFSITKATGTLALTSTAATTLVGDGVTFTATLAPATAGSVTFMDGPNALGTVTLNAVGVASYTTSSLTAGTHAITAVFGGDANVSAVTSAVLTQTINKIPATLLLKNLLASYDGTAKAAGVDTLPANLPVSFTYNGSSTAPTAVGSYPLVATVNSPTHSGTASDTFVIQKGAATVTITGQNHFFTNSPKEVTVTTEPTGLPYTLTYNGSTTPPSALGSYTVVVTINSPNYVGSATDTMVISAAAVTNLTLTSSGNPSVFLTQPTFTATVSSTSGTPSGAMDLLIDGVLWETKQVNGSGVATFTPTAEVLRGGSRTIRANYNANGTNIAYAPSNAVLTQAVNKAPLTVTLGDLSQEYTGFARPVTATVTPPATHPTVQVDITYDGSSIAPINAGNYTVVATINDPSLEGSTSGTLTITKAPVGLSYGSNIFAYDGLPHPFAPSASPNVPLSINYQTLDAGVPVGPITSTEPIASGRYKVTVAVSPNYELTLPPITLSITERGVSITLASLSAMTDGTPKPVAVITNPPGINVAVTYTPVTGGPATTTPPAPAVGTSGVWNVTATATEPNYRGTATAKLTLRARQTIIPTLTGPPATIQYGSGITYEATVTPAPDFPPPTGLFTFKDGTAIIGTAVPNYYGRASFSPSFNARTTPYSITVSYSGDDNYFSTVSTAVETVVTKRVLTLTTAHPATVTYDGLPKPLSFTTNLGPVVPIDVIYRETSAFVSSNTPPTNAGAYTITAYVRSTDINYTGGVTVNLLINPIALTVELHPTTAAYDGTPKSCAYSANPPGAPVALSYFWAGTQNSVVPREIGEYRVRAQSSSPNYQMGPVEGDMSIAVSYVTFHTSEARVGYDGKPKRLSVRTEPSVPYIIKYDGGDALPTKAGVYAVGLTSNKANYSGRTTSTFTILPEITTKIVEVNQDPAVFGNITVDPGQWNSEANPVGVHVENGTHILKYTTSDGYYEDPYDFVKWSDGNTQNPRTIQLGAKNHASKMTYTAVTQRKRLLISHIDHPGDDFTILKVLPTQDLAVLANPGPLADGQDFRLAATNIKPGYIVDYFTYNNGHTQQYTVTNKLGSGESVGIDLKFSRTHHRYPSVTLVPGSKVSAEATAGGSVKLSRSNQYALPNQEGTAIYVPSGRSFHAVATPISSNYIFVNWSLDGVELASGAKPPTSAYNQGIKNPVQEFVVTSSTGKLVANFVKLEPKIELSFGFEENLDFDIKEIIQIRAAKYAELLTANTGNATALSAALLNIRVTAVRLKPNISAEVGGMEVVNQDLHEGFLPYYFELLGNEQNSDFFNRPANLWLKTFYIDPHRPKSFPDPRDFPVPDLLEFTEYDNYIEMLWDFAAAWWGSSEFPINPTLYQNIAVGDSRLKHTVWKWPSVYLGQDVPRRQSGWAISVIQYRVTGTVVVPGMPIKHVSFWAY
jgi:hypothetical protein